MSIEKQTSWLDQLEQKLRELERKMNIQIFEKYREAGLAIIAEGYLKEAHGSKDEMMIRICERMGFKERTFQRMVEIGEMSKDQFSDSVAKFKSLHQWACPSEPKQLKGSVQVPFVILESRFSSQDAAEDFYRKMGGELQGKEPYYIGKILETFVKEAREKVEEE